MKKLTCIAIDDEPIALLIISQFCERKGGLELTTFSEPLIGLQEIGRCKPDLVFPRYKAVIFVHGCFWHMHQCPLFRLPATRTEWWEQKLIQNRQRDLAEQDKLREMGWRILLVWECAIKGRRKIPEAELLAQVAKWLKNGSCYTELPFPEDEQTTI